MIMNISFEHPTTVKQFCCKHMIMTLTHVTSLTVEQLTGCFYDHEHIHLSPFGHGDDSLHHLCAQLVAGDPDSPDEAGVGLSGRDG